MALSKCKPQLAKVERVFLACLALEAMHLYELAACMPHYSMAAWLLASMALVACMPPKKAAADAKAKAKGKATTVA